MGEPRWDALRRKVEPAWDPERAAVVRGGVERFGARERFRQRIGVGAAALAVAACVVLVARHPWTTGGRGVAVLPAAPPAPVATENAAASAASTVTPLAPGSDVEPIPGRDRAYVLRAGAARFEVTHDPGHPFVVEAGSVLIEDIGTVFVVSLLDGDGVEVAVEQGRVRVTRGDESFEVTGGERRVLASSGDTAPAPAGSSSATPPAASAPAVSKWRALAENGHYDTAFASMKAEGAGAVRDETDELLLAADAARLSGHPADALPFLRRVVDGHGGDPRAGLAAFTLGRVLLDELGRPAEAAPAFARARAAGGPMAEDALAREVEAYSRAGDVRQARELAGEYLKTYPNGRRARVVAKFGGIAP